MDESMTVVKKIKTRDLVTANVIIDFKDLLVVKCTMGGQNVPKDFERIVEYYMQHYESTIQRLFHHNGYQVDFRKKPNETQSTHTDPG